MTLQALCIWPEGCSRPARARAAKTGTAPLYCYLEGHTPLKARRLKDEIEKPKQPHSERAPRTPSIGGVKYHPSGNTEFMTQSDRVADLLSGILDVEDLDDEELARGYPRNRNGTFSGRPPKVIPMVVHQRIQREFYKRIEEKMRTALPDAVEMLAKVAVNPLTEDRDKLKAIDMLLNRLMGKPPERVEISSGEKPFEMTMGRMRRTKPAQSAEPEEAE